ncbi:MAG: cellulase family glycosylhydrolase [Cyclobacteriaceae bacterium]|nr:cellulase family glycosylhydrolase [Cyclobacteriaceae bacterium]
MRNLLFLAVTCGLTIFTMAAFEKKDIQANCFIAVQADEITHQMKGGIGASWHAIEEPCQGYNAGSAWGANPDPEDDQAWESLYAHADWLGLNFCRIELEQRMYQPEKDRFTFDGYEMRILYRILDWCEKNKVDVFLQQMWNNVIWLVPEGVNANSANRLRLAPGDMQAFAEGLAAIVEYLIKERGYTCIKYICINNEPGHSWSWWQHPDMSPMPITPGLKAVRDALSARNIPIPLAGPDWTDMPEFQQEEIDFDEYIGAYDIHSYNANFDWNGEEGGYPISQAMERIRDWRNWTHQRNKPFFITEVGTQLFGYLLDDPAPGSFKSTLKDTELIIRAMNLGVDGFNRWSFINRGNLDGQWQLVDTWDSERIRLLDAFTPHPNSYFGIGLLSRFNAKYSSVLKTSVNGGNPEDMQRIFAACLKSPAGEYTLYVINDSPEAIPGNFKLSGMTADNLHRYRITEEAHEGKKDVVLNPEFTFKISGAGFEFSDLIPARSITAYSSYLLEHEDPGIFFE